MICQRLHKVLSIGKFERVNHASKTTLKDDAPIDNSGWDSFWIGLVSYAIDQKDTNGASVKVGEIKKMIDYHNNLGGNQIDKVLDAKFVNDIAGKINDRSVL